MHIRIPSITLLLLALVASSHALVPAQPVAWKNKRATTYQGGWALYTSGSCPQNYSTPCGATTNVVQICCRTTDTCFGSGTYCCPTSQDCTVQVHTFPTCTDPTANMYIGAYGGYFCCENGLVGIVPSQGDGACQDPSGQTIPTSLLATMTSQIGGTSVTPFGGFGTATGAPNSVASGGATPAQTTAAGGSGSETASGSGSTSTSSPTKGFNPSNSQIAGLAVAGAFVLALIYMIWKLVENRKIRRQAAYLSNPIFNPPVQNTSGRNRRTVGKTHQNVPPTTGPRYDPVLERMEGGGVMSPVSPAPAYTESEEHEMRNVELGPGTVSVAEVPAQPMRRMETDRNTITGRMEMG